MSDETANNPMQQRLDLVRHDLQTQITDVYPTPGTIIVVHPRNSRIKFTTAYCTWLQKTLQEILPVGVRGVVVSEKVTGFDVISPHEDDEDYVRGWHDAILAMSEMFR